MQSLRTTKSDKPMTHWLVAICLALLLAGVFGSATRAQRPRSVGARGVRASNSRGGAVGSRFGRARRPREVLTGSVLWPYFDSDSDYDYPDEARFGPPEPQRMLNPANSPAPPAKPAESIVVELRGDHWVRLTSYGPSEISGMQSTGHAAVATSVAFDLTPPPPVLPPAVLVFRDGHQEEASKYTIISKTIYIKSSYWSSGSWTRKILVAELDLPATLNANQARGTKFTLPTGPGEVMIRP
jgi:hypothetical protein